MSVPFIILASPGLRPGAPGAFLVCENNNFLFWERLVVSVPFVIWASPGLLPGALVVRGNDHAIFLGTLGCKRSFYYLGLPRAWPMCLAGLRG